MVKRASGAGNTMLKVSVFLAQESECDSFLGAVCAAGLGADSDGLYKDSSCGGLAQVIPLAGVASRAVRVKHTSWGSWGW